MTFLPPSFDINAAGSCMVAARIVAGSLLKEKVSNVQVIEGWLQFQDDDGTEPESMRFAHTWVETDDQTLDPTLGQFQEYVDYYTFRRELLRIIPADVYLADTNLNTSKPEIFFSDGVIPSYVKGWLPERA